MLIANNLYLWWAHFTGYHKPEIVQNRILEVTILFWAAESLGMSMQIGHIT